MSRRPENLEIARAYIDAGISVIPLRCDGSKGPAIKSWNPYRERFAHAVNLLNWFGNSRAWIGLVCGVLSGGLEVLDFDHEADVTFYKFCRLIPSGLNGKLCAVETAGLGYHVLYRCAEVTGNHKIAMASDGKTLIESRGEGGLPPILVD